MSADLTIFAINSLVRLGQTGIDAFEEAARNEAILFPALVGIELNTETRLTEFFNSPENRAYVRDADAPYKDYWVFDGQNSMPKSDIRSIDALLIAATRIAASRGRTYVSTNAGPAGVLVKTWNEGQGPLSPVARIALVGADIVLEYVGNNPGIIGGGNGAKLISAYATTLSKSLPDDGKLSQKDKFKEAITGTMLRAGFDTLSKHADWVASEDHLVKLIESTVEPLLSAFPVETDSQFIDDIERAKDQLAYIPPFDDEAEHVKTTDIWKRPLHLMTALRAKGKEFDSVVLLDVNDGIWPNRNAKTPEQFEAERRVFYVAFTRARSRLMIIVNTQLGGKQAVVSPYLDELGLPVESATA